MESAWKNIKSAPRDGTEILLKLGEGYSRVAYYEDEEGWFIGYAWNGKPLYCYDAMGWLGLCWGVMACYCFDYSGCSCLCIAVATTKIIL